MNKAQKLHNLKLSEKNTYFTSYINVHISYTYLCIYHYTYFKQKGRVDWKNLQTLAVFGCLSARLNRSSEASFVRRMTKSREGPMSSSSTLGVRLPDFFSKILQGIIIIKKKSEKLCIYIHIHADTYGQNSVYAFANIPTVTYCTCNFGYRISFLMLSLK